MIDEERVKFINEMSAQILEEWLAKLENEPDLEGDKLLATVYGGMIAASLMGYSLEALVNDATRAVERIENLMDGQNES